MRTPRKILHVVHSLQVGGLENGLVNLLNRLDPDRFEQTVCCLTSMGKFAERVEVPTVKLIQLDIPATQFRFPLLRLAKIFRQLSPDVIHTRGWPTVDAVFADWGTPSARPIRRMSLAEADALVAGNTLDAGGMRRATLRGLENLNKRHQIAAAC